GDRGLLLGVGRLLALRRTRPFPLLPGAGPVAELALGQRVAPVAESTLCELHDVALVDQRDAPSLLRDGVLDRGPHQPLRAVPRDGLEADARGLGEADLLVRGRERVAQEREHLLRLVAAGGELDAGVD